jgi:hypothetical protein
MAIEPSSFLEQLLKAPVAIMDTRDSLGLCALTEEDFPALYALQGHLVALIDLGPDQPPGEEMFRHHGHSGSFPKPPLTRQETETERLKKIEARYTWLIGKVLCRGETTLALYEEFGGAPFKGETIRQFMDRFIDADLTAHAEVNGATLADRPVNCRVGRHTED